MWILLSRKMCLRDSPRWLTYFIFASVTLTTLLIYCFCYKLLLVFYTADSTLTKDPNTFRVSSRHSWKKDGLGDSNSNLSDHRTNSSALSIDFEHSSQGGIKNQKTIGWSLKQTLKLNGTIKASSTSSLKRTRTYTNVAMDSAIQGKLNTSVYGDIGCPDNPWKKDFYELFRHWIQISKQYNIKYVLACGSLLGAMRDGDVIPYDSDIDVLVEHSYFSILERLSVKRDFNPSDGKIRLVVQPEFPLNISIDKRRMFNCEGKETIEKEEDRCVFEEPMARLIKGKQFLDVFPFYNRADVVEAPSQKRLKQYHKNDFYPFRPCSFMGLQASCPNNSWEVLRLYFGSDNLEPIYKCKNGSWEKTGVGMITIIIIIIIGALGLLILYYYFYY